MCGLNKSATSIADSVADFLPSVQNRQSKSRPCSKSAMPIAVFITEKVL